MAGSDDEIGGTGAATLSVDAAPGRVAPVHDALIGLAARHDLALDVADMATFELEAGTGVLRWSASAVKVLDCPPAEVEDHLRALLAPVIAAPMALRADFQLEHRIEVGGSEGGETRERFVQLRARSWPSAEHPGRDRLFGAIVDVTERRRSEREMVDLLDRYRLLVELSPDAIVVHEAGIVRYANAAAAVMAKSTVDAMVGSSIVGYVAPDEIEDTLARILSLTEPGMVSESSVATLVAVDGARIRMEVVSVLTTWEGRPAYQVIMRDISGRERAEEAMRAQAALVAAVSDAIVSLDGDHVVTTWNPAAERIFGWSAAEAIGRRLHDLADPFVTDPGDLTRDVWRTLVGGGYWAGDLSLARRDGSVVPVHASLAPVAAADGRTGMVAVCSDQSARRAAEAARTRAESRFTTVVAALDEGIAVVSAAGDVPSLNEAAGRILGRPSAEVALGILNGVGFDPCGPDGSPLAPGEWPVQESLRRSEAVVGRTVGVRRPDGTDVWLRINVHPLPGAGEDGEPATVVCSFSDITEERRAADELAFAASHDALTGLPNRTAMRRAIDEELAATAGTDDEVTVAFCDLDRFKDVNDSLGHHIGDTVLCGVAERLRLLVPSGASVGRLGGDEFIVVGSGLSAAEAASLAAGIVAELSRPLAVAAHGTVMTVTVGASVGVARSGSTGSADRVTSSEMLRVADVALYRAKDRGRNRVEVFDPSMFDPARLRFETREDLRVAIETGQLEVHYQPIWRTGADIASSRIAGFEALVRWDHPERGRQNPADFVALAEDTGLISALGTLVLERACTQTATWRAAGHDVYVSVNLSARQLSDPRLVPTVVGAMARSGLPASALWLELTESALADEAIDAAAVLHDLRATGVRISIDDFGTGYSSLGRLRHLPVSALKVDQSFVADMLAETAVDGLGDGGAIVESTIALAHRLGLSVVAEGVETPAQLAALAAVDCDLVQGFLLSRPLPAEDIDLS